MYYVLIENMNKTDINGVVDRAICASLSVGTVFVFVVNRKLKHYILCRKEISGLPQKTSSPSSKSFFIQTMKSSYARWLVMV